jgi:Tfp pilus assembly protein PilO
MDLQATIIAVLVVAVIFFIVLAAGYYFLFVHQRSALEWKYKLEKKLKDVNSRNLDKEHLAIELDKLSEFGMQQRFNTKESLGKILKNKRDKFSKAELDEIWRAHKLRNKIVHDSDYKPTPSELNYAIISFKQFINNLIQN